MLTTEQIKAIRKIQIRTSHLVSDLFGGHNRMYIDRKDVIGVMLHLAVDTTKFRHKVVKKLQMVHIAQHIGFGSECPEYLKKTARHHLVASYLVIDSVQVGTNQPLQLHAEFNLMPMR